MRLRPLSGVRPRRRGVLGLLAGVAAALIMATVAAADAIVRTAGSSRGTLVVAVEARSGPDGNHGVIVEPFHRSEEVVTRVRQQALGNPSIRSTDSVCDHNPVFNDVVCRVPASRVEVTMGDGDDRVQIREFAPGGPASEGCLDNELGWSVEVTLGSGDDVLTTALAPANPCTSGQFSELHRRATLTANGGGGRDELNATSRGSTLEGGSGNDRLLGTNRGNDTLRGGGGADLLSGSASDTAGDFDTATYSEVTSGELRLTLDDQPNDGVVSQGASEGDNIHAVERVIGGGGNDTINGNDRANTLVGNAGTDSLNGRGGNDVLTGGPDGDELSGEAGTDRFFGGGGNDFIQSRDGVFEVISCGEGIADSVIGDLADVFRDGIPPVRNRNGRDCESINAFAVDDGPPARSIGRFLTIAAGTARVVVACPRNARTACRGMLTARLGGIRGRVVGRARYAARLGRRTTVAVRLANRRPGTRIVLETMEQGVSKKGPRSASRLVLVQ